MGNFKLNKQKSLPKMVKQLATLDEYNTAIASDKLTVVDFTATWCPPCQMIAPKFAEHADKVADYATLVKVDVDENEEAAQAAGIEAMPTFKFFKGGKELHAIRGAAWDQVMAKI